MKAALEKELSALSLEEKNEVVTFLMPFVTPTDSEGISSEILEILENRLQEHRADPTGSITLEQFKNRQFGI